MVEFDFYWAWDGFIDVGREVEKNGRVVWAKIVVDRKILDVIIEGRVRDYIIKISII